MNIQCLPNIKTELSLPNGVVKRLVLGSHGLQRR